MSLRRNLIVCLALQLTVAAAPLWAAASQRSAVIEMAGEEKPVAGKPAVAASTAAEKETAATEPAEEVEASSSDETVDANAAQSACTESKEGCAGNPAAASATDVSSTALKPAQAPKETAAAAGGKQSHGPWWQELGHRLGFAADPHPGDTADAAQGRPVLPPDYEIGAGDILQISVWKDDSMTRQVTVLPDGKIAFPLVGEIVAGGKTTAQLKQELEQKLSRYVTEAGLTVEVKQSNSMIVYVIGKVNLPGRQVLVARTNVLQSLAMAGGPNTFARKGDIKVFRQEGEKTTMYGFDYDDVSEGRHLESNIELKRGDVVLVP